jgi:hypothetical protein
MMDEFDTFGDDGEVRSARKSQPQRGDGVPLANKSTRRRPRRMAAHEGQEPRDDVDDMIVRLWADKSLSIKAIAAKCGRSGTAVFRRAERMGLRPRTTRSGPPRDADQFRAVWAYVTANPGATHMEIALSVGVSHASRVARILRLLREEEEAWHARK